MKRTMIFLGVALLAGCTSTTSPSLEPEASAPAPGSVVLRPAPVVTAPATAVTPVAPAPVVVTTPAPVVVATPAPAVVAAPAPVPAPPAPGTVVTAPMTRVVTYPEGRFQLYGDSTNGYYWVWIPTGSTAPLPPAPPVLPRVSASTTNPVFVLPPQNQIVYSDGRYQLYGDSTTGYYWVWIPTGVVLPYVPPSLARLSQSSQSP
jgi:hypothetical protein